MYRKLEGGGCCQKLVEQLWQDVFYHEWKSCCTILIPFCSLLLLTPPVDCAEEGGARIFSSSLTSAMQVAPVATSSATGLQMGWVG